MMYNIRHNARLIIIATLAIMIVQTTFFAIEVAEGQTVAHGQVQPHNDAPEMIVEAEASDLNEASHALSPAHPQDHDREQCDHCCQCHGHGSHFAVYFASGSHSLQGFPQLPQMPASLFASLNLHSIYRPPIA